MRHVYLDHAATTPLSDAVLAAMLPYLKEHYGNASSVHALGRKARFAVEESRERVAALLGAEPAEIIFTSGGTEADNLALKGVLQGTGRGLVTSSAEHEAILRPAASLADAGHRVTLLTPQATGAVQAEQVAEMLAGGDVGLVSLMHANNELGSLTPVRAVADVCRAHGVPLHTDAVQMAGYTTDTVDDLGVDLMTLSGHKLEGPKGVGVLYVRGGVPLRPLVEGGAQERKRRGGTENVAGVVGLAEALAQARASAQTRASQVSALRDRLYEGLRAALGEAFVCNTPLGTAPVAPHLLNIAFPPGEAGALDGEMLLLSLDLEGVMVSSGSACTSGTVTPSHVLLALGLGRATAAAAVRFSLGTGTSAADVDHAVESLARIYGRMVPA